MGYKIHRFFSPSPCLIGCTDGYFIKRSSDRIFFCLRNVTAEEHGVYILSFFFLPLDWTTWSFLPSASANERKCLLRLKGYAIIRLPHVRSEKKKAHPFFVGLEFSFRFHLDVSCPSHVEFRFASLSILKRDYKSKWHVLSILFYFFFVQTFFFFSS